MARRSDSARNVQAAGGGPHALVVFDEWRIYSRKCLGCFMWHLRLASAACQQPKASTDSSRERAAAQSVVHASADAMSSCCTTSSPDGAPIPPSEM